MEKASPMIRSAVTQDISGSKTASGVDTQTKTKPTAKLTGGDVKRILDNAKLAPSQRMTQKEMAECLQVSMKTISRVLTGQTWRDETQLNKPRDAGRGPASITYKTRQDDAEEMCDFLDDLTAIKNHFALSFDHPLFWGWFDWQDGKHSICSDGFIMWESTSLVNFAQRVKVAEINSHPFFSHKADELPTFEITEIMTKPIGPKFVTDAEAGGIVRLISEGEKNTVVFLRQKYVALAQKHKMEIRAAGDDPRFVYLTKARNKQTADTQSVVMACVSTMKEN